jgi:5,10-methylenetetrahydrofolate reductase
MGALFQGIARNAYTSDLTELGLGTAEIERSVEVLAAWLKVNAGEVAAQFGITVQQIEGVIDHYQRAYTTGVAQVLLIGAAVVAVGAILAWFTFQKRAETRSQF